MKSNDPSPSYTEPIHLSAPHMSGSERQALLTAFDSGWIAPTGPALAEFETKLATLADREAAVGVTSGTSALHLAMLVAGIGPGDIVLCPSVTFVASANVITYVGATPHFIDCDPQTGNICSVALSEALHKLAAANQRPAALMSVDLYGQCADYSTIIPLCQRFGVPIIEDAAESIGATHAGRPAGSFGLLSAFSFNGNKMVTTGGGGALVGPEPLIARARHLAGQAREPELHFEHRETGYAYRLSNLSASIGVAQLDRLADMCSRTRSIHERYKRELDQRAGVTIADQDHAGRGNAWLTVAHLDQSILPAPHEVCHALKEHSIEARPSWKPMHLQPLFTHNDCTGTVGSEAHFTTGLCLPSGSSMTEADQTRVISALHKIFDSAADMSGRDKSRNVLDLRTETLHQPVDSPVPTHRPG